MKNLIVKYLDDNGVCEIIEREGKKVINSFEDIYFNYEDMFAQEYNLLENRYSEEEIEKINIVFEKIN